MKLFVFLITAVTVYPSACLLNDPGQSENVWMSIAPIQCLGNPWEIDWLESHDNDYDAYPRDLSKPGLEREEEQIIRDYYLRQGVIIKGFATTEWDGAVCLACSCPQGYTLYVLIPEQQQEKMLELGFAVTGDPS